MSAYRLTPAARHDLSAIWDYTEAHWGVLQAETYVRELQAGLERLADNPRRGHPRGEVRPGYLSYAVGRHVIFYVEQADGVDVIRVLHQRMDPDRHL
ncbi:type II toxin-antitoxin system RelE/ParE family toxin [Actinomyces ruminicola]|uniref:Toxin n=1 Tax=Actinomyces ruminicola TaxID=332524 RepID=A0A1G9XAS7_9ACTO|nr:type II toxin-antitoxin system RelE/ParE family toxin [Actinomyces ruminicola]SDM93838.1 toxin ParE1/3/4 [Actinomyces ruminicola]